MRAMILLAVLAVGCSSPTAPTPAPPPTVPVVSVSPVVTPVVATPNPLLSDPRFDLAFYRRFALGSAAGGPFGLRRQTQAPRIYLLTVDDAGTPIDAGTLDATAAALINTTGSLTGVFGLAGLEQGTSTREGQTGWITARWSDQPNGNICGTAQYAGDLITLYPKTPGCQCGALVIRPRTVKHELGHALGFYHTDSPNDLMFQEGRTCDQNPSAREIYHARVAYSQPLGSLNPS